MSADTKSLRNRMNSVDSTRHLTKAMGLVASSKIRRATANMTAGSHYADTMKDMIRTMAACRECRGSVFLRKPDGDRICLIVVAGDRGLAGGYNNHVFRIADAYPKESVIPIGKRACDRYGSGYMSAEHFAQDDAAALTDRLLKEFEDGQFDRLGLVRTRYISMLVQEAETEWLLPIEAETKVSGEKDDSSVSSASTILFEPGAAEVFPAAVREYVTGKILSAVRESFACEVAARRTAMDAAGRNADDMLEQLQLSYNRIRQSAITQEITEIVAGSDM